MSVPRWIMLMAPVTPPPRPNGSQGTDGTMAHLVSSHILSQQPLRDAGLPTLVIYSTGLVSPHLHIRLRDQHPPLAPPRSDGIGQGRRLIRLLVSTSLLKLVGGLRISYATARFLSKGRVCPEMWQDSTAVAANVSHTVCQFMAV